MKRSLIVVASIAASLILFSSQIRAREARVNRQGAVKPGAIARAVSPIISAHKPPPPQCPFNIPVVSLPTGPHPSGFNWSGAIIPMNDPCVEGITVDPTDEQRWYVSGFNGLYVTVDGGAHWTHPLTGHASEHSVMISPQNASEVYASTDKKLFRSLNKGLSWTLVHTFAEFIRSVYVAPNGAIYVGPQWSLSDPVGGIFVSLNKGVTWKLLPFGGAQKGLICWDIERDPNDGTLYVSTEISNHPQPYDPPLYRSTNGGATWKDVSGTLPWHVIAMQLRPSDGYLYALTEGAGLYGSADHANTWTPPTILEGPSGSLLMDRKFPKRLFGGRQKFGNVQGGAYVSVNAGLVFHEIGLKGGTIGGMSLNGNSTRLYAAAYASGIYVSKIPPLLLPN